MRGALRVLPETQGGRSYWCDQPAGTFDSAQLAGPGGQVAAEPVKPNLRRNASYLRELLGVARDSCRQFDGVDPGFLGTV